MADDANEFLRLRDLADRVQDFMPTARSFCAAPACTQWPLNRVRCPSGRCVQTHFHHRWKAWFHKRMPRHDVRRASDLTPL